MVDLSNLCRDARFLPVGVQADEKLLDRLADALDDCRVAFSAVYSVADRSLPTLLDPVGRRRLRDLEQSGLLEYSSIADERLLELAFGAQAHAGTLIASMDGFDDFRRTYPAIQGATDRFVGWEPGLDQTIRPFLRDMGVHTHHRMSRKEESAELKARRLRRQSVVRRASETYFRCGNSKCLLAQLWPERLPELPRFDDRSDQFVCPNCRGSLIVGDPRSAASQLIVFLHGEEQLRLLLEEGDRVVIGRKDSKGCVGLESRLPSCGVDAVSRTHVAFSRNAGRVDVEDLESRNGSAMRWVDGSHEDVRLD
ncbi:MAG: FHA domain-containing protein, partial [Ilumatobacteraceae bacterium]